MAAEIGQADPRKLTVAGVDISVRPEVVLRGKDRLGNPTVGAVKLYIGKTFPLSDDAAAYVATQRPGEPQAPPDQRAK